MASIPAILDDLYTNSSILGHFAIHTSNWDVLSSRLTDIKEGINAVELSLQSWQRKYDIHDRRPHVYMHVLFGHQGWARIEQALKSIVIVSQQVGEHMNGVIKTALRAKPRGTTPSSHYDKDLVLASLHRLRDHPSWSRKFVYSALSKTEALQVQLLRLHRKLSVLERLSDLYLESEHPDVFAHLVTRLPGRRIVLQEGDPRADSTQDQLLDVISARKDAELLYRASSLAPSLIERKKETAIVHIGLHVPQIHKRDFSFLLSLSPGESHEIITHPVRIKAVNDPGRVQSSFSTALSDLLRSNESGSGDATYMLPSSSSSSGFQVTSPPSDILAPLEFKDSIATIVREQNVALSQQILYPQDQVSLICGIAAGCWRLLGTRWLDVLDSGNVRWRRGRGGRWTAMMASVPGNASTTSALDTWRANATDNRDSRKSVQIFRLGLLLAEIALKIPVSPIVEAGLSFDVGGTREEDGVPIDAVEIAAEVEANTNVLVGNLVFACLSVLQESGELDEDVDRKFYRDVLGQVEELEEMMKRNTDMRLRSAVGTPRMGRSGRDGAVYR
jgi:hypothetical protein